MKVNSMKPGKPPLGDVAREPGFHLDHFLPYQINVLARRLSHGLAAVYEQRFGITIPEWRVLAHLSGNQAVSVREIHHRVDLDKASISRAASRLETAGYVSKCVSQQDRRLVELMLTKKGRALFTKIAPLALEFEAQILGQLSHSTQRHFTAALTRLLDGSKAQDEGAFPQK